MAQSTGEGVLLRFGKFGLPPLLWMEQRKLVKLIFHPMGRCHNHGAADSECEGDIASSNLTLGMAPQGMGT